MLLQDMYKLSVGESQTTPHRKHFVCIQRVTKDAFAIEIQDTNRKPLQNMVLSTKLLDLFKTVLEDRNRPADV
jgi:hypothetical protein